MPFCEEVDGKLVVTFGEKRYEVPRDALPFMVNILKKHTSLYLETTEHEGRIKEAFAEYCDEKEDCEKCLVHSDLDEVIEKLKEIK